MLLLFWLVLVPFVIRWMNESNFAALPAAAYGFILFMAAIGYLMLERTLIACDGLDSNLARTVGRERKGKTSVALYAAGIGLAFFEPWIAIALYIVLFFIFYYIVAALRWFVPDQRIESRISCSMTLTARAYLGAGYISLNIL